MEAEKQEEVRTRWTSAPRAGVAVVRDGAGTESTGDAGPPGEAWTCVLTGALKFACCHFTMATARSYLFCFPPAPCVFVGR